MVIHDPKFQLHYDLMRSSNTLFQYLQFSHCPIFHIPSLIPSYPYVPSRKSSQNRYNLRLIIHSQRWSLQRQALSRSLQLIMRRTLRIVIYHVLLGLEFGRCYCCVALRSLIRLCGTGVEGDDVWFVILRVS